jgi:hypothetical protein
MVPNRVILRILIQELRDLSECFLIVALIPNLPHT